MPHWLGFEIPSRDTRALPVPCLPHLRDGSRPCRLPRRAGARAGEAAGSISAPSRDDDASRALCLWVNTPGNPAGQTRGSGGRRRLGASPGGARSSPTSATPSSPGTGRPRPCSEHGTGRAGRRSLALEALQPRRAAGGFLRRRRRSSSRYLAAVRRHAGFMVPDRFSTPPPLPSPMTSMSRCSVSVYRERLQRSVAFLADAGLPVPLPAGGVLPLGARPAGRGGARRRPGETAAFALGRQLAASAGILSSPGDAYGPPAPACPPRHGPTDSSGSSSPPARIRGSALTGWS